MRKLIVMFSFILLFITPASTSALFPEMPKQTRVERVKVFYPEWCRHQAVFWGSMVGEHHRVRVMLGEYTARGGTPQYHAQPQILKGGVWKYFEMKRVMDGALPQWQIKFIPMPTNPGDKWNIHYSVSWLEFALIQNMWMKQVNNKTFDEYGRKKWNKMLNDMMIMLRELDAELWKK